MIYAGLRTHLATLTGLAIFGGLLFDSLSGNPLGVSMVSLFVVGFLAHRHHDLVLRDAVYAQFILGCAAGFGAPVVSLLLLLGTGHSPLVGWGTLLQLMLLGLAGGCATPVCFRGFDAAERAFGYPRLPENSFRPDREIKRGRS